VEKITIFSAGIHTGAKQTEAAKAVLKVFTGSSAAAVIKQHGTEAS
jgi:hypothetical protein